MRSWYRGCMWLFATSSFCTCRSGQPSLPADPRMILQSHLSHGIGDSPFDSPLVHDSLASEMIIRARKCISIDHLLNMAGEDQSQNILKELESDGLLTIQDQTACATFPVLLGRDQTSYHDLTGRVADDAERNFSQDLEELLREVEARGWKEWQYHFLWSQLFDSQFTWSEMMRRKIVPPLGHLIAWVVYPGHPFRSGTNYYPDNELRDYWLMVSWRANASNTTGLIGGVWEVTYRSVVDGGPLSGDDSIRLAKLGLLDDHGQPVIPILRMGDPLLDRLRSFAVHYIDFLQQQIPLDSLRSITGVDEQFAFAMAYHDISWGIVARQVLSGNIEVPPGLDPQVQLISPSLRGVAAMAPAYAPFVEQIRAAIEED